MVGFLFAMQRPLLAFVDLVILWCTILLTILLFLPLSRMAGWLMLPYLLWVTLPDRSIT